MASEQSPSSRRYADTLHRERDRELIDWLHNEEITTKSWVARNYQSLDEQYRPGVLLFDYVNGTFCEQRLQVALLAPSAEHLLDFGSALGTPLPESACRVVLVHNSVVYQMHPAYIDEVAFAFDLHPGVLVELLRLAPDNRSLYSATPLSAFEHNSRYLYIQIGKYERAIAWFQDAPGRRDSEWFECRKDIH